MCTLLFMTRIFKETVKNIESAKSKLAYIEIKAKERDIHCISL